MTPQGMAELPASLPEVFAGLSPAAAAWLQASARRRGFTTGEQVLRQGAAADALFVVERGRLKIARTQPSGADSTLALVGPGDVFGEVAMFTDGGRTAQVTALEEGALLVIRRAVVLEVMREDAALAERLLSLMATRLSLMAEQLDDLLSRDVLQRLARRVLWLVEHVGAPAGASDEAAAGAVAIGVTLTQQDLAELVDTTRQTANQLLRRLDDEGIVRHARGRLVVHDVSRLRQLANDR